MCDKGFASIDSPFMQLRTCNLTRVGEFRAPTPCAAYGSIARRWSVLCARCC